MCLCTCIPMTANAPHHKPTCKKKKQEFFNDGPAQPSARLLYFGRVPWPSAPFKATRERQVPTARGRFLCFSFHYIMTASSRFLTCRCFPYKRALYSIRACARVSGKDTQESDL